MPAKKLMSITMMASEKEKDVSNGKKKKAMIELNALLLP